MSKRLLVKYHYYCQILMKLEFSRQIFEKNQISSFIKIRPLGAEFSRSDGQTYMTMLLAAFRNFANAPKKSILSILENFVDKDEYNWMPNFINAGHRWFQCILTQMASKVAISISRVGKYSSYLLSTLYSSQCLLMTAIPVPVV
jgi:hypothetical protein